MRKINIYILLIIGMAAIICLFIFIDKQNTIDKKKIERIENRNDLINTFINKLDNRIEVRDVANRSNSIQDIIDGNQDVISDYLKEYPKENKWIEVYKFDFTGDGQEEIILSMQYAENYVISYNYIFDCEGDQIIEFPWGVFSNTEIYCGKEENTFYLQVGIHFAASDDALFYGKITKQEQWQWELMFLEWDVRTGAERVSNQKEGYYIFDNFSREEAENIWYGLQGMREINDNKEANKSRERLEEYLNLYQNYKKVEVQYIGYILNLEEGLVVYN